MKVKAPMVIFENTVAFFTWPWNAGSDHDDK